MSHPPQPLSRGDFETILAEHLRLIELTNDLEYHLHLLAADPSEAAVGACQQSAGSLVAALRDHLFRQDQVVLPILETPCCEASVEDGPFNR